MIELEDANCGRVSFCRRPKYRQQHIQKSPLTQCSFKSCRLLRALGVGCVDTRSEADLHGIELWYIVRLSLLGGARRGRRRRRHGRRRRYSLPIHHGRWERGWRGGSEDRRRGGNGSSYRLRDDGGRRGAQIYRGRRSVPFAGKRSQNVSGWVVGATKGGGLH